MSTKPAQAKLDPVVPHLVVDNAKAAIDFYQRALHAEEIFRSPTPDGSKLMHASLRINGATVMLCDDFPEMNGGKSRTPQALGGNSITIHLNVDDVDAIFAQAIQAGAKEIMPVQDTFWGDRYGQFLDPFGHHWSVSTKLRDVRPAEMVDAAKKHFP